MALSITNLNKVVRRLLDVIKPLGVIHVDFTITRLDRKNYYLYLTYVVPDSSEYMKHNNKYDPRSNWNSAINKTLQSFLGVHFLITQTGLQAESYYKQQKERENG